MFEQPLARIEYTKAELRALVTRPLRTILTGVVSAALGLVAYSWWLDGERFVGTLTATGSLTPTEVLGLVPTTPLTPVVIALAVVCGLVVLVLLGIDQRMTDRFGPNYRDGDRY